MATCRSPGYIINLLNGSSTDKMNPAVPHMATEADEYNGYYIPKGTVIIGNSWWAPLDRLAPSFKLSSGRSCTIQVLIKIH